MKRKILVIDDDASVRRTLETILRGQGYDVVSARDGAEGLRAYDRDRPDLVITDIIMPEREGIETIREIRLRDPKAKIIAMSGGGRISNMDLLAIAQRLGADRVIAKPFRGEELSATVAQTLAS